MKSKEHIFSFVHINSVGKKESSVWLTLVNRQISYFSSNIIRYDNHIQYSSYECRSDSIKGSEKEISNGFA